MSFWDRRQGSQAIMSQAVMSGRLHHSVTFALIRMVKIGRRRIEEAYTYLYVFIRMYTSLYVYPNPVIVLDVCMCS